MADVSYKVIVSDEKGKRKEINRLINLLQDSSSDRISILEDLIKVYENTIIIKDNNIGKIFFDSGLLSSAAKIFGDENNGDEKIINLMAIIINKMYDYYFKVKGTDQLKQIDAIKPLYNFIIGNYEKKIKEDSIKLIVIITKNYPYDVMNCPTIKDSFEDLLPSNLIKEGIIKKGECGTEIIEEILFIGEEMNKKKNIISVKEELINESSDFIKIAKENGFEGKLWNNEKTIILDFIYLEWKELCKEDSYWSYNNTEVIIKEEEKEKIMKFCDLVLSHPFDIQIQFINKLYNIIADCRKSTNEYNCLKSKKNGLFLYLYLPFLFKIYHFEEMLPKFIYSIHDNYNNMAVCYKNITKLYNEIMKRMIEKSPEDIEINEEINIIVMFLWSIVKEGGRDENEIGYLISLTVKVLECLGRIEDNKNGKENEKVNEKEMIICKLLNVIIHSLWRYSEKNKEQIKKDGKISKILLEIVKNHLKNERNLIQKGNKKRIIEYVIYSYNKNIDTSNLLSLTSHSFPFSHNSVVNILSEIDIFILNNDFIKFGNDIVIYLIELLNNYLDIMKIFEESDIRKEIESEVCTELDDHVINELKQKIYFSWFEIKHLFYYRLKVFELFSLDNENKNNLKRVIYFMFNHDSLNIYNKNKEEKNNDKEKKEIMLFRPFLLDDNNRKNLLENFISSLVEHDNYSILNTFYLINKSEEGCDIINIFMRELSGEIVDRIKRREKDDTRKERRRFQREGSNDIFNDELLFLKDMMENILKDKSKVSLGGLRGYDSYEEKEKEIKRIKDFISDLIEEEDMKECLILFLKFKRIDYMFFNELSSLSRYSKNLLYYLSYV